MKQKFHSLFFILACVATLPACATPLTYSAKEIRGQVVDAETGRPIEGAVVMAQWVLSHIGSGHYGKRLHIHETVTDKNGNYVIPSWGPKPRLPMTDLIYRDPEILIFKSGYEPEGLENSKPQTNSLRVSEWDGKIIKLKKPRGSLEDYAQRLESMSIGLPSDGKEWRAFPRMILALDAENRRLLSLGLNKKYRTSVFEIEYFDQSDKDFLKKFEDAKK